MFARVGLPYTQSSRSDKVRCEKDQRLLCFFGGFLHTHGV